MPKKYPHDAKRNARLAWLSQNICKGQTDAQIIIGLMAAFPGLSEQTARRELREVYQRFSEINDENTSEQKVKFMELGFAMLEEMRNAIQFGPAANHFKTLAQIAGVLTDKPQDNSPTNAQPTPAPEIVRDRITELLKRKKIQDQADELEIDLKDLANKAGVEDK